MQATCPVCFARFALEAALVEPEARRFVTALLALPAHAELALRYLGCFRPAKKALAWRRATRLVGELDGAMRQGSIRRRGRDWPAPPSAWAEALETVLARRDAGALDLPLRDHAYLWEVLARAAHRAEAGEERAVEAARRNGPRRGAGEARSAIDTALAGVESAGASTSDAERRAAYRDGMAQVRRILGGGGMPEVSRDDGAA